MGRRAASCSSGEGRGEERGSGWAKGFQLGLWMGQFLLNGRTVAEKGSSLFFLLVLIPDILSVHPAKEGTAAAADVVSADIIDK